MMQQVFLAKQVFVNAQTIGVLCNTNDAEEKVRSLRIATDAYKLNLKIIATRDLMELRTGFDRMTKEGKIDLVWIVTDDVANQKFGRRFLAEKCMAMKIPLYVPSIENLHEGALFTISTDVDGKSKVFVNRKVYDMIGLSFPQEIKDKIVLVEF